MKQEYEVIYDINDLHFLTNNIYNLPDIIISETSPVRINVLVPAFDTTSMSAGFFGVFHLAKNLSSMGYRVRLVLFDSFDFNISRFRKFLGATSGLDDLLNLVEVEYIGDRKKPLVISKKDFAIATVWYSAYVAEKIRSVCNQSHFLYLIQDYEPGFFPHSSHYALSLNTYNLPCKKLFSTEILANFFVANNIIQKNEKYCFFHNAASVSGSDSYNLQKKAKISSKKDKIFVLYSRPQVDRNMFLLAAHSIVEAYTKIFKDSEYNWKFYGMGIGNITICLDENNKVSQLPRMSLKEYKEFIGSIDICLTLMATPHPSMIPMDIAGSGGLVVTNLMHTRTKEYYKKISSNIIAVEASRDKIVLGIKQAIIKLEESVDVPKNTKINYPTSWVETWNDEVKMYLDHVFKD
ncbi:MAG: hypothetical protein AB8B68_05540 [Rickettsiaceae bacterium]